jgi:hypothetical protein
MLDSIGSSQQEALGVLGVNLIHAAFNHFTRPKKIIESLLADLEPERLEIDMINFEGPYFEEIENRLMNLHLVQKGLTHAILFKPNGELNIPAELLYKKNILVIRGAFQPVTKIHTDMIKCGQQHFNETENINADKTVVLAELTMANLINDDKINNQDFLARVDMLNTQGYTVMVSSYLRYFRLREYFRRYTKKQIGMILGISNLNFIFQESYYEGLKGGILEAFAKLFPDNTRLYIYPYKNTNKNESISVKNFQPSKNLQHLYDHLKENGYLIGLENADESLQSASPDKILASIEQGNNDWKKYVPAEIAEIIITKKLFGFDSK